MCTLFYFRTTVYGIDIFSIVDFYLLVDVFLILVTVYYTEISAYEIWSKLLLSLVKLFAMISAIHRHEIYNSHAPHPRCLDRYASITRLIDNNVKKSFRSNVGNGGHK